MKREWGREREGWGVLSRVEHVERVDGVGEESWSWRVGVGWVGRDFNAETQRRRGFSRKERKGRKEDFWSWGAAPDPECELIDVVMR